MTDKSSIFKVHIDISNIDQHRYDHLNFTVALGRQETLAHMVMRLIAYAMIPEDNLLFGQSGSGAVEPDVAVKDYDDHYIYWVDAGFPSMSRVKKASHQADNVLIFSVAGSSWLEDYQNELMQFKNVHLVLFQPELIEQLAAEIERNVNWSLVVDGNRLGLSDSQQFFESNITRLEPRADHCMAI